ncbi:choline dehydrogenase [compost metagenome]
MDASIMPTIIGCSTTAATVMIGEKASDLIAEERRGTGVLQTPKDQDASLSRYPA